MGSTDPLRASPSAPAAPTLGPEALARVVLRCRELAIFLETAQATLPRRAETPFLYGQLDAVLQRLHASLKPLGLDESSKEEKPAGFLRLLGAKKPRAARASSEARYDLQGNAWTIPVTELVAFLSHSAKSGLLWVTSSDETFVLEFARGSLVHATSSAPPAAFRLGEILVREKMLEPSELAHLIQNARAADDLLGSFLVRSGRLPRTTLQRMLAIQVQELFHRLMDVENAVYRFQEGAQLLRSQGLEVNITQLLLESARKKDEQRQAEDSARGESAAEEPEARAAEPTKVPVVEGALVVLDEAAAEPEPAAPLPASETREVSSDAPPRSAPAS